MKDPILGTEKPDALSRMGRPVYRSLVRIKQDIYIKEGSPLNIRLDSPLKISVAPAQGRMSIDYSQMMPAPTEDNRDRNFRRFKPVSSGGGNGGNSGGGYQDSSGFPVQSGNANPAEQAQAPVQRQAPPPPDPEAHLPRFLRTPKNSFNEKYEPPITAGDGYDVNQNRSANPNNNGNGGGAPQQKGGGDDF